MSRAWEETVDAHRQDVRSAVITAVASLVDGAGLRSVTMSRIAQEANVGRATLYRYFPDLDAVLRAWHDTQIAAHLEELAAVRDRTAPPAQLRAVLEAYALLARRSHGHHEAELQAFLHRDHRVEKARGEVRALIRDLIADATRNGRVRADASPDELAAYCMNAINAAAELPSTAAVQRLVSITVSGLAPR